MSTWNRGKEAFTIQPMDRIAQSGLQDTNICSTALCSPTRAALITGRNHHSAGFGVISEQATGFPGYNSIIAKDNTMALIPGAGINYSANDRINIFAGIHKGFAPPRIKDAITANGLPYNLDAELSTNYELGTRIKLNDYFSAELTGFILDFQNQIIPVSNSSGNSNASGVVNGGQTLHKGIEAGFQIDLGKMAGLKNSYTFESSITVQGSEYSNDRFISLNGSTVNVKEHKLS